MSYQEKYLKYKNKYLILKNQHGGDICSVCSKDTPTLYDGKCDQCAAIPAAAAAAAGDPTTDTARSAVSPHTSAQVEKYIAGREYGDGDIAFSFLGNKERYALSKVSTGFKAAFDKRGFEPIRGEHILSVGSMGSNPDQYNQPSGICSAVDPDGKSLLLVSDLFNKRVVVANAENGKFIQALQASVHQMDAISYPECVAFVPVSGQVLVTNRFNVKVFAGVNDDTVVRTLGDGYGSGPRELKSTSGIAVLDGDVADGPVAVVVDTGNHRLALWRVRDGTVVRHLGSEGTDKGQFIRPTAVTVIPTGVMGNDEPLLVVADSGNRRVQVLTCNGNVIVWCLGGCRMVSYV
jgi:hypothetical protein